MTNPDRKPATSATRPGSGEPTADRRNNGKTDRPTCGDFDMRIGSDGTWFHQGAPISRKSLVKLFASALRYEHGEFWLVTPTERGRISVDDAPFTAVELVASDDANDPELTFRTNIDETVTADADHPIRIAENANSAEPRPYIRVRPGLEALIVRPVFYRLADLAQPGPGTEAEGEKDWGVWSKGQFFPLGRI